MSAGQAPVRVGILGAGAAGRQHHDAILAGTTCRVTAFHDPDPSAALPGVPRVDTADELLRSDDVDLVAFCTPPGERLDQARRAIEAGTAILLEKPPTASTADLDALVEAASAAGVTAGVMLQHRFALPTPPAAGESSADATCVVEVSRPRPADRFNQPGWRSDPERALGGITAHLGVHYLDLACQLLGDPVDVQVGVPASTDAGIDLRATGYVRFAQGGTLAFAVTSSAGRRSERLAYLGPAWSLTVEDGAVETTDGTALPARPASMLRTLVYDDLAAAVPGGAEPAVASLRRARPVMTILEHVRWAAAS